MSTKKKYFTVWKVYIASRDDGPVKCVQDLPLRFAYLIESKSRNGGLRMQHKAMKLAAADDISNPVILSVERVSPMLSGRGFK